VVRRWLALAGIAAAALAPAVGAAPGALGFSGTSNRTLGPFRLAHGETLRWQTSGGLLGGLFALKALNPPPGLVNPQLVFSKSRNGSVRLGPGRYTLAVTVLPGTRWQITIG
jgi:hypothetical protein